MQTQCFKAVNSFQAFQEYGCPFWLLASWLIRLQCIGSMHACAGASRRVMVVYYVCCARHAVMWPGLCTVSTTLKPLGVSKPGSIHELPFRIAQGKLLCPGPQWCSANAPFTCKECERKHILPYALTPNYQFSFFNPSLEFGTAISYVAEL